MPDETSAPGMDSILRAMEVLHGAQHPKHWLLDSAMGVLGPRLEAATAYDAGDHWHFVTLGLSNIWEKTAGDDPAVSGLGYEFTCRVRQQPTSKWFRRRGGAGDPPAWVVRLLQRLGDVTLEGSRFRSGDTLDPGGSITGDESHDLAAVAFVDDPSLPPLDTPNGTVAFVQVVGLTAEQLNLVRRGETDLASFAGPDGLFVTEPGTAR